MLFRAIFAFALSGLLISTVSHARPKRVVKASAAAAVTAAPSSATQRKLSVWRVDASNGGTTWSVDGDGFKLGDKICGATVDGAKVKPGDKIPESIDPSKRLVSLTKVVGNDGKYSGMGEGKPGDRLYLKVTHADGSLETLGFFELRDHAQFSKL